MVWYKRTTITIVDNEDAWLGLTQILDVDNEREDTNQATIL